MAVSFPRPDPSSPSAVSTASFPMARRGFEPDEVRDFLRMVAAEIARLQERERILQSELRNVQRAGVGAAALDEEVVTRLLGEEAARILSTAREAAAQIKARAEDGASRLLREAADEAHRMREEAELESARKRQDASADSEAEIEMAKQQGREMVNEAREYREKVLSDLARRRELARQQIETIVHGRERLIQSFERARVAAVDVMAELGALSEPDEYVNLAPTTGPVPLMVPAAPAPVVEPVTRVVEETVETIEVAVVEEIEELEEVVEPAAAVEVEPEVVVDDAESQTDLDEIEAEVEAEVAVEADVADLVDPVDLSVVEESAVGEEPTVDEPNRSGTRPLPVIPSAPEADADDGDEPDSGAPVRLAKVVSLFASDAHGRRGSTPPPPSAPPAVEPEVQPADEPEAEAPVEPAVEPEPVADVPPARRSVDELFARLRAARTDDVVKAATVAATDDVATPDAPVDVADTPTQEVPVVAPPATPPVFRATDDTTAAAPAEADSADLADTPFTRREAALAPLLAAGARKLKRVLADEQNDVLHTLRGKERITDVDRLVPPAPEHVARYADAVHDELMAAALVGAASLDDGPSDMHRRRIEQHHALAPAFDTLSAAIIEPMRERLDSAARSATDNAELAEQVRGIYREWKTQRIDECLDDVVHTAFGRGAFVVLTPGTLVCWTVDPHGPDCADAEDNTLGGVIGAGERFPTEHVCAPAHEGCRCMLQRAPQ